MLQHLRLLPFLLGLVIGIIAILCIKPEQAVVRKYPNPSNAGKLIYKDRNGMCYKYTSKEVDCDKNESRMKEYPLSK
jgi:hypothetical protein